MQACAGAMCDFGLQYTQQRTPEGLYAFVLEPDVYKVAFFGMYVIVFVKLFIKVDDALA